MARKRIEPGAIVVGERLGFDAYDQQGNLLLKKGIVVTNQAQLSGLISRGLFFDDSRTDTAERVVEDKSSPFTIIAEIQDRLDKVCRHFQQIKDFPERIGWLAQQIQLVCKRDADAALGSILLDREMRYSIRHSIHCAFVCELVGEKKGIAAVERRPLVAAALTQNLAMLDLQDALHSQAAALSPEQKAAIQNHPQASRDLLEQAGVTDPVWLEAVLQHHEALDGKGYPRGLTRENVTLNAQLLHLADIYCAKLVNRTYREPILPSVALRTVFLARGEAVDEMLAALLIKEMGVYPPGTFVRLANAEIAIITQRGKTAHTPLAMSVVNARNQKISTPIRRDTSLPEFAIKEILTSGTANLNVNRNWVWGYQ